MENFTYFNPTRIHFGGGQIADVAGRLRARGADKLGEHGDITLEVVEKILRQAA
jgi:alcohol dehydrogenase YqhD (iron-dependent ADH family)